MFSNSSSGSYEELVDDEKVCILCSEVMHESQFNEVGDTCISCGLLNTTEDQKEEENESQALQNLITPEDIRSYGRSDHVLQLKTWMNKQAKRDGGKREQPTTTQAINARNFLMFILVIVNACRSSNICNMTVNDVLLATRDEEFDAMTIKNSKYGTKLMVIPMDIYRLLRTYITELRPILAKKHHGKPNEDGEEYLFVSSKSPGIMENRDVSAGLSKTMELANVLQTKCPDVTCSRLRTTISIDRMMYAGVI